MKFKPIVISTFFCICLSVFPLQAQENNTRYDWHEEYAYTLGTQAYYWGYPWLYFSRLLENWTMPREAGFPGVNFTINNWFHYRNLVTAEWRHGGMPNSDTPYSISILDLRSEPMVLSHPDMGDRYFSFAISSMSSDNFAYVGKRTTGSKSGSFLIAGPDWDGNVPKGLKLPNQSNGTKRMGLPAISPHPFVMLVGRTAAMNDIKKVRALQDQYILTPLSEWLKKNGTREQYQAAIENKKPIETVPTGSEFWRPVNANDPLAVWKTINNMMTVNKPLAQNATLVQMFKDIGVGPGLNVDEQPEGIKRGLVRAAKTAGKNITDIGTNGGFGKVINGWSYARPSNGSGGYYGDIIARGAQQSGVGIVSHDPEEATFPYTTLDGKGRSLDGSNKYTITFSKDRLPAVKYFWSITMYDYTSNFVDNHLNRYNISSLSGGYKLSQDGSLTLYIQNKSPGKEKESNWLPSPEKGAFFLTIRAYGPGKDIVDQTWNIPGLVKVE